MKSISKMINKSILINIYKQFKSNPKKVFIVSDFLVNNTNIFREKYLHTLISFELIEEVPAIYKFGRKFRARREIKGYKLLK